MLDFVLELHQTIKHHFRPRRAPWYVDVDGYDRIDTHYGRVVVVETAGACADSESDNPLRVGHLFIDPLQDRRHLVADRAHVEQNEKNPNQVKLDREAANRERERLLSAFEWR